MPASVIEILVFVLLAVPTLAWMVVRLRPGAAKKQKAKPAGGTRHRWWQP